MINYSESEVSMTDKTVRLFDEMPYQTEFDAVVTACEKHENTYEIVLDKTLFFPEEGGQSPDKGTVNGCKVMDVQVRDGVIYHSTDCSFEVGSRVCGRIDWKHRFSNMQQHSGEHIFSGIVNSTYGYNNVGFHLSDQNVTMDFDGVLNYEQLAYIEQRANEVIASDVAITVSYPDAAELKILEYRSKKEIIDRIRIVTVDGVDVCACCAPHVRTTGEIGMLKVTGVKSYKGGVRVNILCGFRALDDYRNKTVIVDELMNLLSEKPEGIVSAVSRLKEHNSVLRYDIGRKNTELALMKAAVMEDGAEDAHIFIDGLDIDAMRSVVNELMNKRSGVCACFSGDDDKGYQFVMGSRNKDVKIILEHLKKECQVRGGGSPQMVQGTVYGARLQIENILLRITQNT